MDFTTHSTKLTELCRSANVLIRTVISLMLMIVLTACGVSDRVSKRVEGTWAGDMLYADNEQVVLTADGGNQLNPDAMGAPLSVVLRVYQLSSLKRFASASADDLWDTPGRSLGSSLIEHHEVTLLPGLGQVDRWALNKAARYVGVAAFFRGASARWKVAFDADALRKDGVLFSSNGIRVLVDGNEVLTMRGADVLHASHPSMRPTTPSPDTEGAAVAEPRGLLASPEAFVPGTLLEGTK